MWGARGLYTRLKLALRFFTFSIVVSVLPGRLRAFASLLAGSLAVFALSKESPLPTAFQYQHKLPNTPLRFVFDRHSNRSAACQTDDVHQRACWHELQGDPDGNSPDIGYILLNFSMSSG